MCILYNVCDLNTWRTQAKLSLTQRQISVGLSFSFSSVFALWMRCSIACITSAAHSRVLSVFFFFLR